MNTTLITTTKEFSWAMAHMLDGHEGLCKNLHGHQYKMEVTVGRKNDLISSGAAEGMIIDFKDLKNIIQALLIDELDHAVMLNTKSKDMFESALVDLCKQYHKKMVLVDYRPTAENMAKSFMQRLQDYFNCTQSEIIVTKLKLYETATSYAEVSI